MNDLGPAEPGFPYPRIAEQLSLAFASAKPLIPRFYP